ncbi:MAG: hypothetical protein I8H81_08740 [Pseudomonadales bacterium]|jgi:hypothetical protein|uniref:hypothetical protein n=1 Tax=Pseudomonas sp. p50(2008) TaxID=2816832 RepID=UPI00188A9D92|nr:hypothetical protein [Pseudomonas sp. p50(2008)]MBF4555465.1 hypothetical protein [Pseudomonas sp. p50(2008)]MBH1968255.1 hypothetical protein [Pseudomonadales bacterium]MBH2033360.1 hypothetical protein [Pseudomonadales bacterium]MBH2078489.1 hypothetical protein [Pseudomonadales bacterium]
MSFYNQRGVFLQLLSSAPSSPKEVRVSMQFALKDEGYDPVNRVPTYSLLDSTRREAVSNDGGVTFTMRDAQVDIDGDGQIDAQDKAVLVLLAKAYSKIVNP